MKYIKKVNTIEAIQNEGNILTDVIPFLKKHGIAFEYTDSFVEGQRIAVLVSKGEFTTLNPSEYLVINKGVVSIMKAKDFESKYQEDDSIGRKNINTELSTNITLDTTRAQRAFDLLGETVEQIKAGGFKPEPIRELSRDEINKINRKIIEKSLATSNAKQPHIRIEFDDIRDVPKVWVDGELIGDLRSNRPLVSLNIDWNTDTEIENHKEFDINYQDFTGERPMSRGFREGTLM